MPSPNFIGADLNPPIDVTQPPIATGPTNFTLPTGVTYGTSGGSNDFAMIAIMVLLVAIVFSAIWWYYDSKKRIAFEDVRPSIANLSSREVSLNKAALVQMMPFMPPLIGITPVLMVARTDATLALALLIGLVSMPAMMYLYLKNKSLENNEGKVNMQGYLRSENGDRDSYFWRNVEVKSEKHLTDDELSLIDDAKVTFKKEMTVVIDEREKERKKAEVEIEDEGDVWTRKNLDEVHAIPIRIDNKHDVYLMSVSQNTEWDLIDGEDYDYYGYHSVKVTGPELRKIATMHRVIELESEEHRDEYCPVFLVMYDDKMSKDSLGAIAPIDVTRDHAIAGLTKAIGSEERTTAGELNSITEQVMVLENEDKDLDDLSATLARKKALDFVNSEKRLTMFDVGMLGTVSTIVAIVFSIVTFLLGLSIGG